MARIKRTYTPPVHYSDEELERYRIEDLVSDYICSLKDAKGERFASTVKDAETHFAYAASVKAKLDDLGIDIESVVAANPERFA